MRIVLVGAGATASVIAALLCREKTVSAIICATNNLQRAKKFISEHRKLSLRQVDASKLSEMEQIAKGADLLINASLPEFNTTIMEAALKTGANYQDLCSWLEDYKTAEQLQFHERFKKAGLVAVINTGASPGITNLLAREAADQLDKVKDIKIRLLEEQCANEFIFSWSPAVTIDEFTSNPLVYRKGRFTFEQPFSKPRDYTFPIYGKRHAFTIYGDEVATLPLYIKAENVDYKAAGEDIEFARILYRLGLFSDKPVDVKGAKVKPADLFMKIAPKVPTPQQMVKLVKKGVIQEAALAFVVELTGWKNGKQKKIKKEICFPNLKEITKRLPGATYISYPTGLGVTAFALTIPQIKTPGVYPPEGLDKNTRAQVLSTLFKLGRGLKCPIKKQ